MGIRPENIRDEPVLISACPDACIDVRVEMVERMGSETCLYLSTDGHAGNFVTRVDPRMVSRGDDDITVGFDVGRLRFFDAETEKIILTRGCPFRGKRAERPMRCSCFLPLFHCWWSLAGMFESWVIDGGGAGRYDGGGGGRYDGSLPTAWRRRTKMMEAEVGDMTEFAKNLARMRRQRGATQEALAQRFGLSFQAISKWETGQSMPDLEQLVRLADYFGVSTDALLGHVPAPGDTPYRQRYDQERYYWGLAPSQMCYEVMRLRPPLRPLRVLDVGCGEGKDAVFFARNGYEVSAFDLADTGLEKGQRLAHGCGVRVRFFQADLRSFRPSEEYDIVFSSGALHYLPENARREAIEGYQAATAPGGLHALNVFVRKPFIAEPPDEEMPAALWRSGELALYYADWRFHRFTEEIFDCDSGGAPHQHCMDTLAASRR